MLALRDLQAAIAAHIGGTDRADLMDVVVGDAISAAARLRIHRHHVRNSLSSALAATFPTVEALVGGDFFRSMAGAFVAGDLPRGPVLAEYGADFPAFVGRYEPAACLHYLADVARLDWALNLAFQAPFEPRLTAGDLARVAPERLPDMTLALAAGAMLVSSDYPLDRIWRTSRPGAATETVDLGEGPARLLVLRQTEDAAFVVLGTGEAGFVAALAHGRSLAEASLAASTIDPDFDLSTGLARLLAFETFAALQHVPDHTG